MNIIEDITTAVTNIKDFLSFFISIITLPFAFIPEPFKTTALLFFSLVGIILVVKVVRGS